MVSLTLHVSISYRKDMPAIVVCSGQEFAGEVEDRISRLFCPGVFRSRVLSLRYSPFLAIAVAIFVCQCCFYVGALSPQWWGVLGCPKYSNNILRRSILRVHVLLNKGYRHVTVNTKKLMVLVEKTEHQRLNKLFDHCCGTYLCPIWLNGTFRPS